MSDPAGSGGGIWRLKHGSIVGYEIEAATAGMGGQAVTAIGVFADPDRVLVWALLHLAAAIVNGWASLRQIRRLLQDGSSVAVDGDGIVFRDPASRVTGIVPFGEIFSLEWHDRLPRVVRIGVAGRAPIAVAFRQFGSVERAGEFYREVRRRLPGGWTESLEDRATIADRSLASPPLVTLCLASVLLGIGLAMWFSGGFEDAGALDPLGSVIGNEVAAGQWVRLFSGVLLHVGTLHLAGNLFALVSLGMLLENAVGSRRFLVVLGFSSLVGASCWAFLHPDQPAVGASAAVFGAMGSFLSINVFRRRELPATLRLPWRMFAYVLVFAAMTDWVIENAATAGHLAGFLSGALIALPLIRPGQLAMAVTPKWVGVSAFLLGGLHLVGVAWVIVAISRIA